MITQPWNDDRLKLNGRFIGCITKENADIIMKLQSDVIMLQATVAELQAELQAKNDLEGIF